MRQNTVPNRLLLLGCLLLAALACNLSRLEDQTKKETAAPPAPVATEDAEGLVHDINYALIFPADNGQNGIPIGCDDSVVMVETGRVETGTLETDLRVALEALFNTTALPDSRFVNTLAGLGVSVTDVQADSNPVTIALAGAIPLSGVCADARVEAQLLHTVFQFQAIQTALITLNGQSLKKFFDASGAVGDADPYQRSDLP